MWKKISDWLKSVFSNGLKQFLSAIFTQSKSIIIDALKDIAVQAVSQLTLSTLTNDAKRKAAFDQIKAYAKTKGLAASDSIINLVIELAVQSIKG